MTISTAIGEVWNVLEGVTEIKRNYAAGKTDGNGIPDAIGQEVPATVTYPDTMVTYEQVPGGAERHEYNLKIQVFVSGADSPNRINTALEVFDAIKVAFRAATALNDVSSVIQSARIAGWRFGALSYGGETFTGWEVTLFVSEDSPVTYGR